VALILYIRLFSFNSRAIPVFSLSSSSPSSSAAVSVIYIYIILLYYIIYAAIHRRSPDKTRLCAAVVVYNIVYRHIVLYTYDRNNTIIIYFIKRTRISLAPAACPPRLFLQNHFGGQKPPRELDETHHRKTRQLPFYCARHK